MFTFRTFRTKGWAHKRDRVRVNDSDLKVQTLALIAAIDEDGGLIDFAIHPLAINTETFVAFVRQLAGKLGGGGRLRPLPRQPYRSQDQEREAAL